MLFMLRHANVQCQDAKVTNHPTGIAKAQGWLYGDNRVAYVWLT